MKSNVVFQKFFQKHGVKQLAAKLGLSEAFLYKWCQPDGGKASGGWNPIERIAAVTQATGDLMLVQCLCQQCGGYFVPNPKVKAHEPEPLLAAHSRVVREFGELIALVCEAAGDNRITEPEAQRIRQRWEALKTLTDDFAQCCERGDFQALHAAMLRQSAGKLPVRLAPPDDARPQPPAG